MIVLTLGCAGCGRVGDLDAPPVAGAPAVDAATAPDSASPMAKRPKKTKITPPKTPFFLDPLV